MQDPTPSPSYLKQTAFYLLSTLGLTTYLTQFLFIHFKFELAEKGMQEIFYSDTEKSIPIVLQLGMLTAIVFNYLDFAVNASPLENAATQTQLKIQGTASDYQLIVDPEETKSLSFFTPLALISTTTLLLGYSAPLAAECLVLNHYFGFNRLGFVLMGVCFGAGLSHLIAARAVQCRDSVKQFFNFSDSPVWFCWQQSKLSFFHAIIRGPIATNFYLALVFAYIWGEVGINFFDLEDSLSLIHGVGSVIGYGLALLLYDMSIFNHHIAPYKVNPEQASSCYYFNLITSEDRENAEQSLEFWDRQRLRAEAAIPALARTMIFGYLSFMGLNSVDHIFLQSMLTASVSLVVYSCSYVAEYNTLLDYSASAGKVKFHKRQSDSDWLEIEEEPSLRAQIIALLLTSGTLVVNFGLGKYVGTLILQEVMDRELAALLGVTLATEFSFNETQQYSNTLVNVEQLLINFSVFNRSQHGTLNLENSASRFKEYKRP